MDRFKIFLCSLLFVAAKPVDGSCPNLGGSQVNGYTNKYYTKMSHDDNVVNPARGFYQHGETSTSNFNPLSSTLIPDHGDYNIVLRLYYLDTYLTRDLDSSILTKIRADMNVAKSRGWTVLLRFAYTATSSHDARLSQVLRHISSLKHSKIFQDFEGIIAAIQAGFIGEWGEWHYTNSDFGKPGSCSDSFGLSTSQWNARHQVLQALLDASPKSIEIQVRIPAFKYHLYGKTLTTLYTDRAGTDASRIGFHNDAFLSDTRNQGTFVCPNDADFMAHDSVYNSVAGETNSDDNPSIYGCSNAKSEMERYHYTAINHSYLKAVTNYWKSQGCYDEIAARLGYRLYLTKASLPNTVSTGSEFCYEIHLGNEGFAAPTKQLVAKIILRHTDGTEYSNVIPHVDVRTWQPGVTIELRDSFSTSHIKSGTYRTYLVLALEKMSTNNKYNVLLANTGGVQVSSSRRNDLHHNTVVSGHATSTGGGHCHAQLVDGSFESGSGWHNHHDGFSTHSSHSPENGHHYITVSDGGAYQDIDFTQSSVTSFTLSGYGRAHSSASASGDDYSIYCDITFTDGNNDWGKTVQFDASSTSWVKKTLVVHESKPIANARCYAMFRNGSGSADFDNFKLESCS